MKIDATQLQKELKEITQKFSKLSVMPSSTERSQLWRALSRDKNRIIAQLEATTKS